MSAVSMVSPVLRFTDSDGAPLAGGKVYFYAAGTTTPKDTYTTSAGTVAHTNPVILDSTGSAAIYLNGTYKINLLDADDVQQSGWPQDNISSFITQLSGGATFSDAAFTIQNASDTTKQFSVTLAGLTTGTEVVATPPTSNFVIAATNIAQTFSGAQKCGITSVTSASNHIAIDLSLNNCFSHTLTEDTTLDNPTNITAGQSGAIYFTQHASSPKTLAFGTYWYFIGGDPSLTASNNAMDTLYYSVRSSTVIECELRKGWAS